MELAHVQCLDPRAWPHGTKPFWIRIAPLLVTGRRYPDHTDG